MCGHPALLPRYRLKPYNGGLRLKQVRLDGWMQLMNDAKLIDQQFTLQVSAAKWLIKHFGALLPESHLPSRHFSRPPSVSRTSSRGSFSVLLMPWPTFSWSLILS